MGGFHAVSFVSWQKIAMLSCAVAQCRPTALERLERGAPAECMLVPRNSDDPRMTNSSFIEGYSTNGSLSYAPYSNDARISYAHVLPDLLRRGPASLRAGGRDVDAAAEDRGFEGDFRGLRDCAGSFCRGVECARGWRSGGDVCYAAGHAGDCGAAGGFWGSCLARPGWYGAIEFVDGNDRDV